MTYFNNFILKTILVKNLGAVACAIGGIPSLDMATVPGTCSSVFSALIETFLI